MQQEREHKHTFKKMKTSNGSVAAMSKDAPPPRSGVPSGSGVGGGAKPVAPAKKPSLLSFGGDDEEG